MDQEGGPMTDDETLVEKQRKLSMEARKSVSMTSISESLLEKIRGLLPKKSVAVATPSGIPPWRGIRQRRFVIVRSKHKGGSVNVIWIDDDDSCLKDQGPEFFKLHTLDDEGFMERKDWHSYTMISEFRKANAFAIRCPASLTFAERQKIELDDPPDHYKARLRAAYQDVQNREGGGKIEEEETFQ